MSTTGGNYRITFKRIGRNHDVPQLELAAGDAEEIAEKVYRYARRYLVSRNFEVLANLEDGTGMILAGFNNGGTFTIAELPAHGWPLPAVEIEDAEAAGLVVRPESPAAAEAEGGDPVTSPWGNPPPLPNPPRTWPMTVPVEPCCGVLVGEEHDCPAWEAEVMEAFASPIRWSVTPDGVEAQR